MNHFMGDWVVAAVAARVVGTDEGMLLRRLAVAGVRLGNAELIRGSRCDRAEVGP